MLENSSILSTVKTSIELNSSYFQEFFEISSFGKLCFALGFFYVLRQVYRVLKWIFIYFLLPSRSFHHMKGSWCVITGSSYGIGFGFAKQLAKRGLNVVLMARTRDRLEDIAKDLEKKYGIQTKVIVVDFASREPKLYIEIERQLQDLNISILVNNVGIMSNHLKYFHEHTKEEMDEISHLNIHPLNHMTRIILPMMRKRKFGKIIIVSSASGLQHLSFMSMFSVYGATKAYNLRLASILRDECFSENIEILCITPFFVTSKITKIKKANLWVCSEDTLAKSTLDKLGYNFGVTNPYWFHSLQENIMMFFGYNWLSKIIDYKVKMFIRNKQQTKKN
jgi:17beta-estradiol 17-dehydrogenase / very-long-chain 3-oxoacyl-CoA reductase